MAFYVHVPFCAARCSYCDYAIVEGGLDWAARLVTATLAEVRALRAATVARPLAALYIGGGTPSLLPRPELRRLLAGLAAALALPLPEGDASPAGLPVEWTLEANPEDLDPELLQLCATAGINRLSVGAQSFDDDLLLRLGRRCTREALVAALELLVRHWTGRLNVDLLSGVPGQRRASVVAAVDRVADLGIDHVTLLQLEDPPPGGPGPSADADELWLAGGERLREHGYCQYEVTHFGRGGDRSHYLCHSLLLQPVAGVGPGAAGTVPAVDAAALYGAPPIAGSGALRISHEPAVAPYVAAAGRGWGAAATRLTPAELFVEHLLHGLRLAGGVPADGWFTPSPARLLHPLWEEWQEAGLAQPRHRRLVLTQRGRLQLNRLAAQAAAHLEAAAMPGAAALVADWPDGGR